MIAIALLLALELPHRAAARESHPGIEVEYGAVALPDGSLVRTIATAPKASKRFPGIFVVGWLSCDSVELNGPDPRGVNRLLQDLVRQSGALVLRMDKPGVGDSPGDCARLDFDSELSAYRAAFRAFLRHPRLDQRQITVVGISNGGGFAPLVAEGAPVARYVSIDGWTKTWFEHMIALERRRLALTDASSPTEALKKLTQFHAAYLFDRLTPAEVVRARPALDGIWYDEPDSQYGRPARFYHQLQALDLAAAWAQVKVPTLVVWGEYDWIMDRSDQELIRDLVGAQARLLVVPRADHVFSVHPDARTAYRRMGSGDYPSQAAGEILAFVRAAGAATPAAGRR
jgi:pimeloyl-ACP methyl ester carboxylesterase